MRRRDIVAVGGKDHQRVADAAKVGEAVFTDSEAAALELIADEQVFDDRQDFLTAEEEEAPPPALELQKAVAFPIDMREQIGVFLPLCLGFEILEVLGEPGAVESAVAEI